MRVADRHWRWEQPAANGVKAGKTLARAGDVGLEAMAVVVAGRQDLGVISKDKTKVNLMETRLLVKTLLWVADQRSQVENIPLVITISYANISGLYKYLRPNIETTTNAYHSAT